MKKVHGFLWTSLISAIALVACPSPVPSGPAPVKATFNGVKKIDATKGSAQVSISALDKDNVLLASGTITEPSATISATLTATGLQARASFQATSSVCGGIATTGGNLTAILMLDGSGSMAITDPGELRNQAAKSFVDRMGTADRAAIGSFSSNVVLPVQADLTSDKPRLKTAIDTATYAGGGTNLWGAAFESTNFIAAAAGSGKVAIIFTDGEDNGASHSTTEVISNANNQGVKIYMVGFGVSTNASQMTAVATGTNGIYRGVGSATDLKDLFNTTFNAATASGCIEMQFNPKPTSGTTVNGTLQFKVNGTPLSTPFNINF
jgi:Ca-activated chloride channel homolog